MQLFEVIRWGNDSDDPMTGGPDGPDTCFLVRAGSVDEAARLADQRLATLPHEHVAPWSHAVYLLGDDAGDDDSARILRGPYVQSAYVHGWRQWYRNERDEPWEEKVAERNGRGRRPVRQSIAHVALVVRDYDEALAFYVDTLGFRLVEDTPRPEQDKRWVVVAPPGPAGTSLLLARATTPEQQAMIGNQAGGRVFLFLQTNDFWRDCKRLATAGVTFVRPPSEQEYGMVAVFQDPYGNLWDLLQYNGTSA